MLSETKWKLESNVTEIEKSKKRKTDENDGKNTTLLNDINDSDHRVQTVNKHRHSVSLKKNLGKRTKGSQVLAVRKNREKLPTVPSTDTMSLQPVVDAIGKISIQKEVCLSRDETINLFNKHCHSGLEETICDIGFFEGIFKVHVSIANEKLRVRVLKLFSPSSTDTGENNMPVLYNSSQDDHCTSNQDTSIQLNTVYEESDITKEYSALNEQDFPPANKGALPNSENEQENDYEDYNTISLRSRMLKRRSTVEDETSDGTIEDGSTASKSSLINLLDLSAESSVKNHSDKGGSLVSGGTIYDSIAVQCNLNREVPEEEANSDMNELKKEIKILSTRLSFLEEKYRKLQEALQ